ncbi:endonuclease/exonuclease/phosphatase family protein [Dokdonella sp.]|uniref:endonuclease/exonuclease/phosphatase family protein n=1 Tax=Dokdonella sp. TaxID=2291710 RepID=UPI001B05FCC0|nr:endonuclease/exonuclease/phosphatase family protein [Dokdonella sp.]MBO9662561.1 endonuclease/exonuclease/phosphatase family protein [Dokdonella sp.]
MRGVLRLVLALAAAVAAPGACAGGGRDTLSVVTLNLWHDKADWPKRQALIAETLKKRRPDVIALQEVLQHETLPNQAQTLAAALGYRCVFVSTDPPERQRRYGNAVLTRHPILREEWKALRPLGDYRTALHLRLGVGARSLDVYATHLAYEAEAGAVRREQVEDLLAWRDATAQGDASIVVGDFNAPADAPEFAPLAARYRDAYDTRHPDAAQDSREHSTLNLAYYAPLRIDHVMFDPHRLTVVEARRLFDRADRNGTWASDHYGVFAALRWLD